MSSDFVDFYEVLQVSQRADPLTISRVYRHLAKIYHPDNQETGDRKMFDQLTEGLETLTNAEKRAAYDLTFEDAVSERLSLLDEAVGCGDLDSDRIVRDRLLSVLYQQRRRDVRRPALGEIHLERMINCPQEHIEYHIWYLKEKQWVERTDKGFAITALGIDVVEALRESALQHQKQIGDGTTNDP